MLCLSQNDFTGAVHNFTSVEGHFVGTFGSVMSVKDVALGAVMCDMATIIPGKQCLSLA
jgi:hypothetical protein